MTKQHNSARNFAAAIVVIPLGSYCGQTGSLCGPNKWLNKNCDGAGKDNTGDSCCTKVLTVGPGKFYDSCSSDAFPNPGAICGPGDAVNLLEPLYCCLNPTPTPPQLDIF